ncbi:MAG TPA: hypothetical protein VFL61_11345 [Gaiellaceae bacterium]|nr:hypothetical protein [Gaiellaceae bacterium]
MRLRRGMTGFSIDKTVALLACACGALALAAPAAADVTVGVADDRGKLAADGGAQFLADMRDVGLTENRITVPWDPDHPTTIRDQAALDRYVANAAAAGIRLSMVIAPSRARVLFGSASATSQFVAFVARVARTYRQVKDFAVGNEPNQPRFWQPQFSSRGAGLACTTYARVLAQAYDALKAVDRSITVVGVSLSPRGNDNALAATNASTSPVRCIRDMGAAYRASRRRLPIMDELAFHPHPNSNTDNFLAGYRWPNAGTPNLGRIKQAIWDAFHGTAQPVFAERGRPVSRAAQPPLRFRLNEIGWQTAIPADSMHAYYGRESVARVATERHQSDNYSALIPYYSCDSSVRSMLYYGLVDEPDLDRWQAGLMRADGTRKPSYGSVKSMLSRGLARCTRRPVTWRHSTVVVGASARFGERRRSARDTNWTFVSSSEEATLFRAAMYRLPGRRLSATARKRLLAAVGVKRAPAPVLSVRGKIRAHQGAFIRFRRKRVKPGYYVFAIRLRAEMNPTRTTALVSRPFAVGTPR